MHNRIFKGLEHTKFSMNEKWNNYIHSYETVSAVQTKYEQLPEKTPLGLTLGFHGWDINLINHSFIKY